VTFSTKFKVEVDVRAKIPRHTANQPRDLGGFGGCIAGCNVACYRYMCIEAIV
jgi:hypothetical protein